MDFFKENILGLDRVQLTNTLWFSENGTGWLCRVWLDRDYGQSYGKNKFSAFRLAKKDLNIKLILKATRKYNF